MSESEHGTDSDAFVAYPKHSLVGAFDDIDSLRTVIGELKEKGFAQEDIRSFVGQEGIEQLDFDGASHGSMAEALRALQHIGPDRTYLERYEKYMRDGDSLLMVHAPRDDRKQVAAQIMRNHSPHRVTYFGTLVIEEV